jgi:hypothetical protein
MSGALHSLPQYAFMAWWSVKKIAQGQLYFYLYLTKKMKNNKKGKKLIKRIQR